MLRSLFAALTALVVTACVSAPAPTVESMTPVRVLYLSQAVGWVHQTVACPHDDYTTGCLSSSENALIHMAGESSAFITIERTRDARDITPEALNDIDVLVCNTTGPLPIDRPTWAAIVAWIEGGRGGFVGIHSAADTQLAFEGGREVFTDFIGGQFDGHPWTEGTPVRLRNLEPDHPLAAMWPNGTDYAEEIYQYSGFRPGAVRVLQSLDMSAGPLRRPYPVPVTWVKQIGEGRLFFTNLGHTPSTWDDPRFRAQIVTAIRWAAGRMDGEAAPNPDVQARDARDAFSASQNLTVLQDAVSPALADDIRSLQGLYRDAGDPQRPAFDAAVGRIRDELHR